MMPRDRNMCGKRRKSLRARRAGVLFFAAWLAGCVTSNDTSSSEISYLAPPPPAITEAEMSEEIVIPTGTPQVAAVVPKGEITPALLGMKQSSAKGCRASERLDREAALAYQWGRDDRNRVSFDVDGLNFSPFGGSSNGIEQVRVEYRLKLQPFKNKKEKCRGSHNWQGMVGTGYRELIVREDDTVWDEMRALRDELF